MVITLTFYFGNIYTYECLICGNAFVQQTT
jgi:hypothetical protein